MHARETQFWMFIAAMLWAMERITNMLASDSNVNCPGRREYMAERILKKKKEKMKMKTGLKSKQKKREEGEEKVNKKVKGEKREKQYKKQ